MSDYNFENFNDYEFEILCRDLINEQYRLDIRTNHGLNTKHILSFDSFKKGKDQGIDLYYNKDGVQVVGQIKHSNGKFDELFRNIKTKLNNKNELDKVQNLKPTKYIFMTSVSMSLANKEKLMEYFSPFIKSIHDIYSRADLNKLLATYDQVERRHVKLYFNSPLVLQRLLDYATISRSIYSMDEMTSQINDFVQTSNFKKALSVIDHQNLLIIKGLPGVGKSTLAKLLTLYYIESGFHFVEISDLDQELERILDSKRKCIFYYDDFLGANEFLISDALRNENKLSRILRRISQSVDKKIILTTRTNILKKAIYSSEKLSRIFRMVSDYEVNIEDLSYHEKEQILFRHIKKYKIDNKFFKNGLAEKIITHKNFSPRLIEFITEPRNVMLNQNDYNSFALKSFNFPEEIWSYSYNQQITHFDKIYLNHLFLLGNYYPLIKFKDSFTKRINYEVKNNNYCATYSEFKESTNTLDATFVSIESYYKDDIEFKEIKFINPSLVDFLIREIRQNLQLIANSISSCDNIDLLTFRFNHKNKDLLHLLNYEELKKLLLNNETFQICKNAEDRMRYFEILGCYFNLEEIENIFKDEILNVLRHNLNDVNPNEYCDFINEFKGSKIIEYYVTQNFNEIVKKLFQKVNDEYTFRNILDLFEDYKFNLEDYLSNEENKKSIYSSLEIIIEDSILEFVYMHEDLITCQKDIDDLYIEGIKKFKYYFKKIRLSRDIIIAKFDKIDWEQIKEYQNFKNSGID